MSTPALPTSAYTLDLTRFVNIWFNADHPDVWLPLRLQRKLAERRKNNPTIALTLLFSKKLLNDEACAQLQAFAEEHKITLQDFDLLDMTAETPEDKELYRLACLERDGIKQPSHLEDSFLMGGGNPAAMSDLCRWMAPVMKMGVYFDMGDVELNLKGAPKMEVVSSPILSDITLANTADKGVRVTRNNDILAFPVPNPGSEQEEAAAFIKRVQIKLIGNYNAPFQASLENIGTQTLSKHLTLGILKPFFTKHPKGTLIDLRAWYEQHFQTPYGILKLLFPALQQLQECENAKHPVYRQFWDDSKKFFLTEDCVNFPTDTAKEAQEYWLKFLYSTLLKSFCEIPAVPDKSLPELEQHWHSILKDSSVKQNIYLKIALKSISDDTRKELVAYFSGPGGLPALYLHEKSTGMEDMDEEHAQSLANASIHYRTYPLPQTPSYFTVSEAQDMSWLPSRQNSSHHVKELSPKLSRELRAQVLKTMPALSLTMPAEGSATLTPGKGRQKSLLFALMAMKAETHTRVDDASISTGGGPAQARSPTKRKSQMEKP